jgi:anti-sigma factor ChrR (cupin superfamily)
MRKDETGMFTPCGEEGNARLYALGMLDSAESRSFERHLGSCTLCEAEVRQSRDLAVALIEAGPLAAPPPGLRDRVLLEVPLPRDVAGVVRGSALQWRPTPFEGVFTARLYADSIRGERASLLRVAPGAKYPSHHHSHVEHCYVLQGDVVFSDHTLYAGDYEAAFGGTDHSAVTTHTGCLLFLIHNQNDEVYL